MTTRGNISFLILLLFSQVAFSQLECSNWYFGNSCSALKFSSATVVVAPNGYTPFGEEACSVLSDPQTGALKFYTDGNVVIDATHNAMPNGHGLIALTSSWGSGKIVSDPGNCNRYYIFHNDGLGEGAGQKRFLYSIVDMSLPGNGTVFNPKGDVAPGLKNILISNNVVEGIEIIPVAKSHDFWVLTTSNSPSAVAVYKFTATGINLIASYPLLGFPTDIRAIRFCETTNKLSIASLQDLDDVLIMDFNTATGEISRQAIVPGYPTGLSGANHGVYDLCWSPDGSKLYISKYCKGNTGGKLYQHDLSTGTTTLIYDVSPNNEQLTARGLKLGPDGKIYFLYVNDDGKQKFVGAVNNPNNAGMACNFNARQINMINEIQQAYKFPDFLYISNQLRYIADTLLKVEVPCNATSVEMEIALPFIATDLDTDKITYAISSIHQPTATAYLTTKGIYYKNTATPPYTDTITLQYCDDYCIKKCKLFRVIIDVKMKGNGTLLLPDSIISCDVDPIPLDAGPGMSKYVWSTGDTTQQILVSISGLYTVTAKDINGCVYVDSTRVSFKPKPSVSLGPDISACAQIEITIDNSYSQILWNTGGTSPSLVVKNSGTYWVMVTSKYGCIATDTISITIHPNPTIDLGGPYNFCENVPIHHVFQVDNMRDVVWSTGSTQHTITVTTPGTYSVTATDLYGCRATAQTTITLIPAPVPVFNVSDVCKETAYTFRSESTIASGNIQTSQWNFGDATNRVSEPVAQHSYTSAGIYDVTLIVTSDKGCTDSVIHHITVYDLPVVDFNYSVLCPGNLVNLQNNSDTSGIIFWKWDFGDGSTDQQKNPSHMYSTKGNYPLSLTATNDKGCVGNKTKLIAIKIPLHADFKIKNACEGKQLTLIDNSSFDDSETVHYIWDFGDSSTLSTEKSPQHIFATAGIYLIKFKLLSDSGCVDSISKQIKISPNPKADFTATNQKSCAPLATNFIDLSTISSGKIVSWQWQLGNRIATVQNPDHTYHNLSPAAISYNVRLLVTSDSGCSAETMKPNFIEVYPSPTANFLFTPKVTGVTGATITFKNNSQRADSAIWNFGDSTYSTVFDTPPHQYTYADTFMVTLTVYNKFGCKDITTGKIIVQPEFTFYIPNSFTPDGDGLNETFSGKGEEVMEYEMIIFNRWGDIMFRTTDIQIPWNGSKNNNNELAAQDVYVYMINIVDTNKKKHFYKGTVTLVR
ncbi:MAG TPA: PKD domain-containing protein [Bacteroidia bacterium]|nr:PKD domain-containing protein [Bacteroidia bacterium]